MSAISLTSSLVKASAIELPLACRRMFAGPSKRRNDRSPKIERRVHVRTVYAKPARKRHTWLSRTMRKKRVSGSKLDTLGIWRRKLDDLNLYGCGAERVMLYATTLLRGEQVSDQDSRCMGHEWPTSDV